MQDPLDEALGLPPLPIVSREPVVPEKETEDHDYEFARENIYRAVAKIEDALDELQAVARISQHPRAYEVYANLAKTFVETNKDLLNLRKTQKESSSAQHQGPASVTHNNTVVITGADMLRNVKDLLRANIAKVIDGEPTEE
jgi:type II secretory pathway component GspD/PulD (secretin)